MGRAGTSRRAAGAHGRPRAGLAAAGVVALLAAAGAGGQSAAPHGSVGQRPLAVERGSRAGPSNVDRSKAARDGGEESILPGGSAGKLAPPGAEGRNGQGAAPRVRPQVRRSNQQPAAAASGPKADGDRSRAVVSEVGEGHPPEADGRPARALQPPVLLADSPARFPPELQAAGASGEVELELLVDSSGRVTEVALVRGAHPLFDAAAVEAAPQLRFRAATMNGVPVAVRLRFSYRFVAPAAPAEVAPQAPPTAGAISGQVRSKGSRRPVPDASVTEEGGASARSDEKGRFHLELPEGERQVLVRAPGFRPRSFRERIRAREALEVVYALEPLQLNPYETVVVAERERTEVSRVSLRREEVREVPGTLGDPFRVVTLLPGVGSMLSGIAYPIVRGAAPASTGYFLDGIRVPILFHLFVGPAVVHPEFIGGIDFYPGAPPPQYGRLLGGVIDGKVAHARDDRLHFSAYADLFNVGGFVEIPIARTGTDVALAGRFSFTPWLLALTASAQAAKSAHDPGYVLDFWDYQGRVEQRLLGGRLRVFAFGSNDELGTISDNPDVATAMQSVRFHRLDLRYVHPAAGGEIEVGATVGQDALGFDSHDIVGESTHVYVRERSLGVRASYRLALSKELQLSLGGDFERRQALMAASGTLGGYSVVSPSSHPLTLGSFGGAFLQLVWLSRGWTIALGARLDTYHLDPEVDFLGVGPRLTARRKLGEAVSLKASAGLFDQQPTTLLSLPVADLALLRYGLQRGVQLELGVEWKPTPRWEISVDGYFNPLLRTFEVNPFDPSALTAAPSGALDPGRIPGLSLFAPGDIASIGRAWGVEVLVRRALGGNWFGWVSYAFQQSTRYARFIRYDASGNAVGRGAGYLPYAFDQTHIANAVLSYRLPANWTVGAVLHFNTGRPETGAMTSATFRPGADPSGQPVWFPVSADQADRLPPFFRVDARVSKSWAFDEFSLEAYLDVMNATFSTEVVAFNYSGGQFAGGGGGLVKTALGLPIVLPTFGVRASY